MCLSLALVGGVAFGWPGALAGAAAGAGLGALWVRRERSREARRRAAAAAPFPPRWRAILAHRYDHYDRLPGDAAAARSRAACRRSWPRSASPAWASPVTDELRVLVAASAATLSLAWDAYPWDQLAEVLLYAQDFDRDYSFDGPRARRPGAPLGHDHPLRAHAAAELRRSRRRVSRRPARVRASPGQGRARTSTASSPASTRRASRAVGGASREREMERMRHGAVGDRPLRRGEPGRVPGRGGGGVLRAPARAARAGTRRCTRCCATTSARIPRPGTSARGLAVIDSGDLPISDPAEVQAFLRGLPLALDQRVHAVRAGLPAQVPGPHSAHGDREALRPHGQHGRQGRHLVAGPGRGELEAVPRHPRPPGALLADRGGPDLPRHEHHGRGGLCQRERGRARHLPLHGRRAPLRRGRAAAHVPGIPGGRGRGQGRRWSRCCASAWAAWRPAPDGGARGGRWTTTAIPPPPGCGWNAATASGCSTW